MKRKMRTILRDALRDGKSRRRVYAVIVFLSSALLALSMFYAGGDTIEKSIANTMPLVLNYTNDNYFGTDSPYNEVLKDDNPALLQELSKMYLEDLKELAADENVGYAGWNEILTARLSGVDDSVEMAGVNDRQYFELEGMDVEPDVLARFDENSVLLADDNQLYELSAGDHIQIVDPLNPKTVLADLEVIGTYHMKERFTKDNTKTDMLINYHLPIVMNSVIESVLEKCPSYYGYSYIPDPAAEGQIKEEDFQTEDGQTDMEAYFDAVNAWYEEHPGFTINHVRFNHIFFEMNDLDQYNAFYQLFNQFSLDENQKIARESWNGGSQIALGLKTEVNRFGSILQSIGKVKRLYRFVLTGIWLMLLFSLYGFIAYMQRGREREIFIFRSLGASKMKTDGFYQKYYLISAILPILIGCIPGYLLSWILSVRTAEGSTKMQQEIGLLTGYSVSDTVTIGLFDLSYQKALAVLLAVIGIMLAVIALCTWITTNQIMHGKLSEHARGGISE